MTSHDDKSHAKQNDNDQEQLIFLCHELRNSINAITLLSRVLLENREGNLTRRQQDRIGSILHAGEHLAGLTLRSLEEAQLNVLQTSISTRPTSPARLCHEIYRKHLDQAGQKGIKFHLRLSGSIPDTILTDPLRIEQILTNLIINAINHTERGNVELRVYVEAYTSPKTICFEVSDSGAGMTEVQQKKLFQPVTQPLSRFNGNNDSNSTGKGLGIGLFLSRKLSRQLGGEITLHSSEGAGSRFTLRLPVYQGVAGSHNDEGSADSHSDGDSTDNPIADVLADSPGAGKFTDSPGADEFTDTPGADEFTGNPGAADFAGSPGAAGSGNGAELSVELYTAALREFDNVSDVVEKTDDKGINVGNGITEGNRFKEGNSNSTDRSVFQSCKPSVLIVDDNTLHREAMMEYLQAAGLLVTGATGSDSAMEALGHREPDAVILDLVLPDINGLELLQHIRNRPEWLRIPVLIYTGRRLSPDEEVQAARLANGILFKGIGSHQSLRDRILALVSVESDTA